MSHSPAVIAAGAVALSTSATLASLMVHLRRIGAVSEEAEREIYERALMMIEESQGEDKSGVFERARELIEEHLRPDPQ